MKIGIQNKIGPILTILFLVFGLVVALYLAFEKIPKLPEDQSLNFLFAIDRSSSYGLSREAGRKRSAKEIFDAAKGAMLDMLESDIFQKGDTIIGIYSFTDEKTENIPKLIDQNITVGLNGKESVLAFLRDKISMIELRKGLDYETYYRNVLDLAYLKFKEPKVKAEQAVFIILTDERGSEVDMVKEKPPEDYSEFNVIKLVAKASEPGVLDIVPNELLLIASNKKKYTEINGYVEDARKYYIKKYSEEILTLKIHKFVIGSILVIGLWIFLWSWIGRSYNTNLLFQPKAPTHEIVQVLYNPVSKAIIVSATFPLPKPRISEQKIQNYGLETPTEESTFYTIKSIDFERDSHEAILHLEEELEPRLYLLLIHDMKGNLYKKLFEAKPVEKAPEYSLHIRDLRDYYNPRIIRLGSHFLEVTEGENFQTKIETRIHHKKLQLRVSTGMALLLDPNSAYSAVEFEDKEIDVYSLINNKIIVELPKEGATLELMLKKT